MAAQVCFSGVEIAAVIGYQNPLNGPDYVPPDVRWRRSQIWARTGRHEVVGRALCGDGAPWFDTENLF